MTYQITDDCIMCGRCVPECVAVAISEGTYKYDIDPYKCYGCGSCSTMCPVGAAVEVEA